MKERLQRSHQRRSEGNPFGESSSNLQGKQDHSSIRLLVWSYRGPLEITANKTGG